jgi:hypothetical protein
MPRCSARSSCHCLSLGPKKAPADLALKLRLAISREAAQARRPRFEGALVRLENALNAFMVPATAGLVSAVLFFGLLLGFFALPAELQASSGDVPLMLYTGPQLRAIGVRHLARQYGRRCGGD